jgi:hypothetical protein
MALFSNPITRPCPRHHIVYSDRVGCTFVGIASTVSSIIADLEGLDPFWVLRVHSSRRRIAFGLLGPARRDGHDVRKRPLPRQRWWRSSAPGPDHFGRDNSHDFIDCYVHCFIVN